MAVPFRGGGGPAIKGELSLTLFFPAGQSSEEVIIMIIQGRRQHFVTNVCIAKKKCKSFTCNILIEDE